MGTQTARFPRLGRSMAPEEETERERADRHEQERKDEHERHERERKVESERYEQERRDEQKARDEAGKT